MVYICLAGWLQTESFIQGGSMELIVVLSSLLVLGGVALVVFRDYHRDRRASRNAKHGYSLTSR